MKRVFRILFIAICIAVMLFSGYQIYRELAVYEEGDSAYEALETYITPPETSGISTGPVNPDGAAVQELETAADSVSAFPAVDFDALRQINSDVVGWLYCPDTVINYPVVQTTDDSYYLTHLFDRTTHKSGCLFLEAANEPDFSDMHSIIYGHHMKNGSMFQSLSNYKKQTYYDEHPTLLLVTPEQNYTIRLFAGYICPGDGDAWKLSFSSDAEFEQWLQTACRKSTFSSGITPTYTDHIITLSTCSYEYEDARYVVLGILEPEITE